MTVKDIINGSDWIMLMIFIILASISTFLLTGHGGSLIAGYNTSDEEEKSKYDEKKLCRVAGAGMSVITVSVLVKTIFEEFLSSEFVYIFLAIVLIDCAIMIILMNTVCKK